MWRRIKKKNNPSSESVVLARVINASLLLGNMSSLFACVLLFSYLHLARSVHTVRMQGALGCLICGLPCWTEHGTVGLIN